MGDETSYSPNQDLQAIQDHETSQELVTQEQSGDLASMADMETQVFNGPEQAEPAVLELEPEPVPAVEIRASDPAPLVASASHGAEGDGAVGDSARELLGLPLQFLNQLLQRIGSTKLDSLDDLIPAARLVGIALLAGVALKLTGATLGAINDIPLLGGLLELTGLVAMLNFLARNALAAKASGITGTYSQTQAGFPGLGRFSPPQPGLPVDQQPNGHHHAHQGHLIPPGIRHQDVGYQVGHVAEAVDHAQPKVDPPPGS